MSLNFIKHSIYYLLKILNRNNNRISFLCLFQASMHDHHHPHGPKRSYIKDLSIMLSAYVVAFACTYLAYPYVKDQTADLFWQAVILDILATTVVFVFSFAFGNSSIYDPYWAPVAFVLAIFWVWVSGQDPLSVKQLLVLIPLGVYQFRHLYLYFIHWTGLDYEDFRYRRIKRRLQNYLWLYWIVSYVALHIIPTVMIILAMIPAYNITQATKITNVYVYYFGVAFALGSVLLEHIADTQLTNWRRRPNKTGEFIDEGLWKYSRHPNYLAEILFWVGYYIMDLGTNSVWNWTWVGPLSIFLLFVLGTIPMMEAHLLERKPTYVIQQKRVSQLFFWFRNENAIEEHRNLLQHK